MMTLDFNRVKMTFEIIKIKKVLHKKRVLCLRFHWSTYSYVSVVCLLAIAYIFLRKLQQLTDCLRLFQRN